MIILPESHLDHHLTKAHVEFIMRKFGHREGFFKQTVRMPRDLSSLPVDLHGPAVGEPAVSEAQVFYARRGTRPYVSRLVHRKRKMSRLLSVIAGPYKGSTALFTAYGGPIAPREPNDPALPSSERSESVRFWKKHALGCGS